MLKLALGNPYVLIGIGALIFLLACGNITFYALWDGAAKGEKAANLKSDLHEADATRWQDAAEARLTQIVGLSDQMTRQSAAIAATASARDRAEQRAAGAATLAATAQAALNDMTLKWETRAHAHPEDVRTLGPAACDNYRSLYGQAAACTDPVSAVAH